MLDLDAVKKMLAGAGLAGHESKIIDALGLESVDDFAMLAAEDVKLLGLKPVQRRKFQALIDTQRSTKGNSTQLMQDDNQLSAKGNSTKLTQMVIKEMPAQPQEGPAEIVGNSNLAAEPPMELLLHFRCSDGQQFDLRAASSCTVHQLSLLAMEKTGIHCKAQRLIFAGRTLCPNNTLEISDLIDDANIFMLAALNKFPQRLGPFETSQAPLQARDLSLSPYNDEWSKCGAIWIMEEARAKRHQIGSHSADFPLVGQFSPTHPVTLTDAEKEAVNIPRQASEFVWSYPVADVQHLEGGMSSAAAFLSVGGFVYLDRQHRIVGVNTLMPQDSECGGLQFSQPKKWNSAWTMELMRDGRFQPITIKALNDIGAKHFCWLRPGEIITGIDGRPLASQPDVPHGGFAYLFHNNVSSGDAMDLAMDCYYSVVSGEEYKQPEKQNDAVNAENAARFKAFQLIADLAALQDAQESLEATTNAQQVNSLQDEIQRLQHRLDGATKCVVCQDNDKNTMLLDCNHVCVCKSCADKLHNCPICRSRIKSRRRAYA